MCHSCAGSTDGWSVCCNRSALNENVAGVSSRYSQMGPDDHEPLFPRDSRVAVCRCRRPISRQDSWFVPPISPLPPPQCDAPQPPPDSLRRALPAHRPDQPHGKPRQRRNGHHASYSQCRVVHRTHCRQHRSSYDLIRLRVLKQSGKMLNLYSKCGMRSPFTPASPSTSTPPVPFACVAFPPGMAAWVCSRWICRLANCARAVSNSKSTSNHSRS